MGHHNGDSKSIDPLWQPISKSSSRFLDASPPDLNHHHRLLDAHGAQKDCRSDQG